AGGDGPPRLAGRPGRGDRVGRSDEHTFAPGGDPGSVDLVLTAGDGHLTAYQHPHLVLIVLHQCEGRQCAESAVGEHLEAAAESATVEQLLPDGLYLLVAEVGMQQCCSVAGDQRVPLSWGITRGQLV